jgi:AraC family transcriptional regulator
LVLDRGTKYSLEIDGTQHVETLCLFFRDGFLEEALRSISESDARLLDTPADRADAFALLETVRESAGPIGDQFAALRRIIEADGVRSLCLSGAINAAAVGILGRSAAIARMSSRLPVAGRTTRQELARRLIRAHRFMQDGFTSAISLSDIASHACLSPFHFHRSFRAFFGETPHQMIVRLRLDRAADRLRRTNYSITDIALAAGFESAAHFSRAFKFRFRCSPHAYRTRLRV